MKRSRVQTSCAVLALLVSTAPSHAETVVETASRWDLLGTWRASCNIPAYFIDLQETYVVRGTTLFFEQDAGNGKQTSTISSAAIQDSGKIELTLVDEAFKRRRKIGRASCRERV